LKINLGWVITYAHDRDLKLSNSPFFQTLQTTAPYNGLRAPLAYCYRCVRVEPTLKLRVQLKRKFPKIPSLNESPRPPYSVVFDGQQVDIKFSTLVFEPRIVSIKFQLVNSVDLSFEELAKRPELLNFRDNSDLDRLLIELLSALTGDDEGVSASAIHYDHVPVVTVEEVKTDHFPTWQERYRQEIVRILIRNMSVGAVREELVQNLFVKSERFNYKTSDEYLLLDKQGLLMLAAPAASKQNRRAREKTLSSALDLTSLALVYRSFLVDYLKLRLDHPLVADFLLSRLQSWCHNSSAVLHASVTNNHLWNRLADEFRLPELFDLINAREYVQTSLREQMELFDSIASSEAYWKKMIDARVSELSNA
jgi:hypothetical protein